MKVIVSSNPGNCLTFINITFALVSNDALLRDVAKATAQTPLPSSIGGRVPLTCGPFVKMNCISHLDIKVLSISEKVRHMLNTFVI